MNLKWFFPFLTRIYWLKTSWICAAMFRDEPDEKPFVRRSAIKREFGPCIFGDEPEERPKQRARPWVARPMILGEEPEEIERNPSSSSRPKTRRDHEDHEDEAPSRSILSLNWSGLKMFSQAMFSQKVTDAGKEPEKKRSYDMTKRGEKTKPPAADFSYKTVALDPARLDALVTRPKCKCGLIWVYYYC